MDGWLDWLSLDSCLFYSRDLVFSLLACLLQSISNKDDDNVGHRLVWPCCDSMLITLADIEVEKEMQCKMKKRWWEGVEGGLENNTTCLSLESESCVLP